MALQRTCATSLIWISFQGLKNQVKVKLSIVSCPPVTTVLIKRPDLKFQLGFSVQNGIVGNSQSVSNKSVPITGGNFAKENQRFCHFWPQICSLMRGGIAERGGVRVGHRIIEINGQSVVAMAHEKIVQTLSVSVGEVRGQSFSDQSTTPLTRLKSLERDQLEVCCSFFFSFLSLNPVQPTHRTFSC